MCIVQYTDVVDKLKNILADPADYGLSVDGIEKALEVTRMMVHKHASF